MRQIAMAAAMVAGLVLAMGGTAFADKKGEKGGKQKSKIEMAETAKVTIDQAVKTASEKVPGKVIEAELEKKHGKTVWEVEIMTDDKMIKEIHIDADSGEVIDVEDKGKGKGKGHKEEGKH
ncbi:MAG: PepSY domain-containing protein [Nitrospiraceae bacterium]